jgi:hypothetical protein
MVPCLLEKDQVLFTQPAASSKRNAMNFDFFIGQPPPPV